MNDIKNQLTQKAKSAKEQINAKFESIFANVDPVKGRPNIESDEILVNRTFLNNRFMYIVGAIITFVPPFIWGPIVLFTAYYLGSNSGVMLTNRRLVIFDKLLKPQMYKAVEIPLHHINYVKVRSLLDNRDSLIDRLLGSGAIYVNWESPTSGTRNQIIEDLSKAKKLAKDIQKTVDEAKSQ